MRNATSGRLGPYLLGDLIGSGGMGEVYRARDERLQRDVAIKVLPAAFSQDADRLERFQQEARAAAALNHPNILSVYDVGTQDGSPYIVSELLEGESLRDRLRSGPLAPHKAVAVAIQLARGLSAAHNRGIVHRDLKPENIFLTADGRVKILDFGIAKLVDPPDPLNTGPTRQAGTAPGLVIGTAGYMSPEQVRGRPTDHRTDLFSFGAVLYEMLSARRAFQRDTSADTLSAILHEDPPELTATHRNISAALERIVRRCLEKEPQQRSQSASDIAFHLGELPGTGSNAEMPAAAGSGRRRTWIFAAAAAAGLLVAAVAGFAIARSRAAWQSPEVRQVTFRNGIVTSSHFAPDGQTIVCAAQWGQEDFQLYSGRLDGYGMRPLGIKADRVLAISRTGEIALLENFTQLTGFAGTGTLARVPLSGGAPRAVAEDVQYADWSPDGGSLAIVRLARGRGAYRLEYPPGNAIYETSGWITDVRFSRDGKWLGFIDHRTFGDDLGRVAVIPAGGGAKQLLGPEWGSAQGLAWSDDGKEIWFSAGNAGLRRSLHAVSMEGAVRLLYSVPGGVVVQDRSAAGGLLVNHANERRMLMVSTAGSDEQRDLTWLDWPIGLSFSADGKQLLFTEQGEGGGRGYSVYLRGVDGSPAVRLGDGDAIALSPDGKWAVARVKTTPTQFTLLPTGAGEVKPLTRTPIEHISAGWFPDGKRLVFVGTEGAGHQPRTYLLDLDGSERPLTPEGLIGTLVTPDGRFLLVRDTLKGDWRLFAVDGGASRPVPVEAAEAPLRFAPDGESLYVATRQRVRLQFSRVHLATGRREALQTIGPVDPVGVAMLGTPAISPDARTFGYQYRRTLSTLYVIDGLR